MPELVSDHNDAENHKKDKNADSHTFFLSLL